MIHDSEVIGCNVGNYLYGNIVFDKPEVSLAKFACVLLSRPNRSNKNVSTQQFTHQHKWGGCQRDTEPFRVKISYSLLFAHVDLLRVCFWLAAMDTTNPFISARHHNDDDDGDGD